MKNFDQLSFFYNEVLHLIDLNDYEGAIKFIKNNLCILKNDDDHGLAYAICGFMNNKLGDHSSAVDDFSVSIDYEMSLDLLQGRSKDISLNGRSNSRYMNQDFQGAMKDKIKAREIRLIENDRFSRLNYPNIDYKNIILGTFDKVDLKTKYTVLIKIARIKKSKYDLIEDYKKVINKERKEKVIKKLEILSNSKYKIGDFKGAIKAIRRAEKFY